MNKDISSEQEIYQQVKSELTGAYTEDDCVDLAEAARVVEKYSGTLIPLVKPKSYHVRVSGQDNTVYAGNEDQLEAWEDHYLPERMAMEVIGAIDDFPCEAYDRQLVLLLCEDGNIYAYEDEVLHLIARSLRELLESGMTFPGIKLFNLGECFEDYTEEECEKIMECDEVKKMREEHTKFRESLELQLLESLLKLQNRQTEKELEEGEVWSRKTSDSSTTTKQDCWDLALRPPMPVVRWTKSDAVSIYSRSHTYQNHSHSNCKVACTGS